MNFNFGDLGLESTLKKSKIHIRVQQRNGKKCITSIQGLDNDLDQKRICKAMRKLFNCNGNVVEDEEHGEIIQLQGDQRDNVRCFLIEQTVVESSEKDRIVVHGF
jgi:translation initiation factor 1